MMPIGIFARTRQQEHEKEIEDLRRFNKELIENNARLRAEIYELENKLANLERIQACCNYAVRAEIRREVIEQLKGIK